MLADTVNHGLIFSRTATVFTTQLRRVSDLARANPFDMHIAKILALSPEAPAPVRGPFNFVTEDDDTSDLHIVFTGSGGRLRNPAEVTPKPKSADASGNEITILWDPPLPKGTEVQVKVRCPFPIKDYRFEWSYLV
jgi:hypothetical protein